MHGIIIDISANNTHPITWPEVKASGVVGVVLKATQGTDYVNPDYAGDLAGATAAGLPVIAYHFADFTTASAEAQHFLSVAADRARVLDSETNPTVPWQNAFLADLGLPPTEELDYGSASTLPRSGIRCPLWPADYGQHPGEGVMWQFTDNQTVPGIVGPVDASYWLGTPEQFDALFSLSPAPAPTPTPKEVPQMYCTDPESGQVLATTPNGALFAEPGITDLTVANLEQHPTWHAGYAESIGSNPCVGITPWKDPNGRWGYCFLTQPTSGTGGFGCYDLYHFARTGTPH